MFRGSGQGKPGGKRGELFVLRPRRAKNAAELRNAAQEISGLKTESFPRVFKKFSLFDAHRLEPAAAAGMEKRFAKELAIGRVNQRVRRKSFLECGERFSRSKEKSATR